VCAQSPEVLCSFGNNVGAELDDDAAGGAAADGDVQEALGVGHVGICGISGDFSRFQKHKIRRPGIK